MEKKYKIFREFGKKNPKIYNNNMEDISKQFSIDKNRGNQFFFEQTKIDEVTFFSTAVSQQQQVVLNANEQNVLTQKIANILSTGDDNISYKKVMDSLSKKLIEEVGTERTTGRPINIVLEEINKLESQKQNLEHCTYKYEEYNLQEKQINLELEENNSKLHILNEIKKAKETIKIEEEKIKIKENLQNENKLKISNLKGKTNIKIETNNKRGKINLLLIPILIVVNIIINILKLSKVNTISALSVTIIYLIFSLIIYLTNKKKTKKIRDKNKIERIKIEKEIEILEDNIKNNEKEIVQINNNIEKIKDVSINKIKGKLDLNKIENAFDNTIENLNEEIKTLENSIYSSKLRLNTINIERKNIEELLENKVSNEEKLKYLYEQKDELKQLEKIINIAKQNLEEAYNEIKENITPKFTKDLSENISKITNGKYKNANFSSDYGLTVEKENGEYINCNKLSIGTIDQLYLSLRLSTANQITEEKVPIILDESFAYFDNERLENILKFINENFDNQIIIFTCSNREKEIMDKLNIKYNLINL